MIEVPANLQGVLDKTIANNSVLSWSTAIGTFVVVYFLFTVIHRVVHKKAKNLADDSVTNIYDAIASVIDRIGSLFFLAISLSIASHTLALKPKVENVVYALFLIAIVIQIGLSGNALISYWVNKTSRERRAAEDAESVTTLGALSFFLRFALWIILLLLFLDNLGFDITTLVAGLGVGSVAIALAVQNILGDIFCSISIILDKPFVVGDFIVVGDKLGVVDKIGIKSTRLQSLSGEQIIISNSDLIQSRIQNFKRMSERRVLFTFGVTYSTPTDVLEQIPKQVREIIESKKMARFDRAHFKEFGDSSLNVEVVYYVRSREYNDYMDLQQAINLDLKRKLEEQDVEFAFPTRTLYLINEESVEAAA